MNKTKHNIRALILVSLVLIAFWLIGDRIGLSIGLAIVIMAQLL